MARTREKHLFRVPTLRLARGLKPTPISSAGNRVNEQRSVSSNEVHAAGSGSQAQALLQLTSEAGLELFHTPAGEGYATVNIADHRETWPVRSRTMSRYLRHLHYAALAQPAKAQAITDARDVLESKAIFDGPEIAVHVRVAYDEGVAHIDLGDVSWRAVEVHPDGWKVVGSPRVRFRRAPGMLALPAPVASGNIRELRALLNLEDDDEWALTVAWLVQALHAKGPYPVLGLHGEHGSAKSTAAGMLRGLVDPNAVPLRAEPRDQRDLAIAAKNSHVIALDNVSRLQPWLSDSLCRMSTGGGFATRSLRTDDEEMIVDCNRPIIITGIEEVATRSDLLDRTIIVRLPEIPERKRREERELWKTYEAARPRILGALLTALGVALRDRNSVRLERRPRMADFATLATAAEPALGLRPGAFARAYAANCGEANDIALESSNIAQAVQKFLTVSSPWTGTAGQLLTSLEAYRDGMPDEWPRTPRGMAGALRRIAPNLRAAGVRVEVGRRRGGGNRDRMITLARSEGPTTPSLSSPSSRRSASVSGEEVRGGDDRDDGDSRAEGVAELPKGEDEP